MITYTLIRVYTREYPFPGYPRQPAFLTSARTHGSCCNAGGPALLESHRLTLALWHRHWGAKAPVLLIQLILKSSNFRILTKTTDMQFGGYNTYTNYLDVIHSRLIWASTPLHRVMEQSGTIALRGTGLAWRRFAIRRGRGAGAVISSLLCPSSSALCASFIRKFY